MRLPGGVTHDTADTSSPDLADGRPAGITGDDSVPGAACCGQPRFRLSDASGVLRFEEFRIAGAPECSHLEEAIRAYLLGRPLAEVDLAVLRGIQCPANGGCLREVIGEVQKHQRLFVRNEPHSAAAGQDVLAALLP